MAKKKTVQKNQVSVAQFRDIVDNYNQFIRSLHQTEKSPPVSRLAIIRRLIKKLIVVGVGAFFTTAAFYFLMDPLRIYNPGLNGLLKKITQCLVGTELLGTLRFYSVYYGISLVLNSAIIYEKFLFDKKSNYEWPLSLPLHLLVGLVAAATHVQGYSYIFQAQAAPSGLETIAAHFATKKKLAEFMLMKRIREIIDSIKDTSHFQQAFTHISFQNESGGLFSYETLEFLGDSVLGLATSLFLYRAFPHFSEGQLSKLKQLMVRESTLAYLSQKCGLADFLQLGAVEKDNRGAVKTSILADIFESFLAALYLEKGEEAVYEFLIKGKEDLIWDYKSRLQEFCQAQKNKVDYYLKETKKISDKKIFVMEVRDELDTICEVGCGSSKKEAEQQAARKAIHKLEEPNKKSMSYSPNEKRKIILDNFNYPTHQLKLEKLKEISQKWQMPFFTFRNQEGNCGDILHLLIKKQSNCLEKIYFSGQESCLLTISSSSILFSYLEKKNLEVGRKIIVNFQRMIKGENYFLDDYPHLKVFSDLPKFPHRQECKKSSEKGAVQYLPLTRPQKLTNIPMVNIDVRIPKILYSKDIETTQTTAWFIFHELRFVSDVPLFKGIFKGIVEIDETYLGGSNSNRH
ncbi:21694_t:CDS:2 [Gigaspora margarita]|uniref:21694_t:CDS:1 n=1 Tax=Gigaspora margarita TaxID=4874 RepID=A0ABM8VV49_GIGMA|nr:21694_t:CDS:2 [Gigaspora margarita]